MLHFWQVRLWQVGCSRRRCLNKLFRVAKESLQKRQLKGTFASPATSSDSHSTRFTRSKLHSRAPRRELRVKKLPIETSAAEFWICEKRYICLLRWFSSVRPKISNLHLDFQLLPTNPSFFVIRTTVVLPKWCPRLCLVWVMSCSKNALIYESNPGSTEQSSSHRHHQNLEFL